mmetsp:Transcript_20355/g.29459  ORF Transcript_20355/g.29459 Transcript_20355/m.29459 type:complete len:121 (-) Transcript_20355:63-425(-)
MGGAKISTITIRFWRRIFTFDKWFAHFRFQINRIVFSIAQILSFFWDTTDMVDHREGYYHHKEQVSDSLHCKMMSFKRGKQRPVNLDFQRGNHLIAGLGIGVGVRSGFNNHKLRIECCCV